MKLLSALLLVIFGLLLISSFVKTKKVATTNTIVNCVKGPGYKYDERPHKNQCKHDCDCDRERTCSIYGLGAMYCDDTKKSK